MVQSIDSKNEKVDKAVSVNLSLYPRHISKVTKYVNKNKKYNGSQSKFIQDIIDSHGEVSLKRLIFSYLIYPAILCCVGLFGTISTQNLIEILVSHSLYFDELYLLNRVFTVISFGFLSVLIACFYILKKKVEEN